MFLCCQQLSPPVYSACFTENAEHLAPTTC